MHGPRATKGTEWLLLKHGKAMKPISKKQDDTSALSGRTMAEIAGPQSKQWISNRQTDDQAANGKGTFKSRIATLAKQVKRGSQ